ncbi:MAG TPA: PIN domain-containing protein [Candidatus Saccharimonadales bacterium]|nr:PIN domain-containing protein [Candidatus Saccharimonadales bacterium]
MILDTNALSAAADRKPSALEVVAHAEHLVSAVSVLDIDEETTHSHAVIGLELKTKGKPIPASDLWIAALCRQHSLPLLSRDRHFDFDSGLQRIDW